MSRTDAILWISSATLDIRYKLSLSYFTDSYRRWRHISGVQTLKARISPKCLNFFETERSVTRRALLDDNELWLSYSNNVKYAAEQGFREGISGSSLYHYTPANYHRDRLNLTHQNNLFYVNYFVCVHWYHPRLPWIIIMMPKVICEMNTAKNSSSRVVCVGGNF